MAGRRDFHCGVNVGVDKEGHLGYTPRVRCSALLRRLETPRQRATVATISEGVHDAMPYLVSRTSVSVAKTSSQLPGPKR